MPRDNFKMSERSDSFGMQQRQDRFDAIGDLIRGPEGPAGKSAYEVAVDNGFVGTEEEWLASLVGPPGADGTVSFDELTPAQKESLRGEGVPAGGTTGQVLAKSSNADYATRWVDAGGNASLTILSYGHSTWSDFIAAYNSRSIVYCRASSDSDPASGSQTRLAFMAYVNSAASPTSVEFQYYRSVSSHTDAQQGDQVYIYKLTSAGTWTVTVRDAFTKIVAGTNMTSSYSGGTLTLNATGGGTADALPLAGGTMSGDINMSGNKVSNLPTPTANGDAVNKSYADAKYTKPSGGIPASDLASAVQTSLGLADSALQSVPSTYRAAAAQDAIDAGFAKTNEVGIVINGKRPGRNATAGQYVIVRNSTISNITDGLYVVRDGYTLSTSTDVTAASLSAVNIGGLNFLLSKIEDSGWINLKLTSAFTLYGTSAVAQYRKIGNLVMVRGQIKPTSEIAASGTNTVMSSLPTGFRPSLDYVFVCQGSSANRWTLTTYANGNLGVARYGTTEFVAIPTNAWLVFNVMFFVG